MRVLLLGGSDVAGAFGAALAKLFAASGATVLVVANAGAKTADYLPGGRFAAQVPTRLNAPLGFDMAVLALGESDAPAPDTVADNLRAIANSLPTNVVWCVGSPTSTKLYFAAHRRFGARFIDSRAAPQGGEAWAALVFARIKRVLGISDQLTPDPISVQALKKDIKPWMVIAGVAFIMLLRRRR